jgi:putative transposase
MARANRHYVPGYIWHITHRCHKREFLFKFAKDRLRWMQWLYTAKKKYNLVILNYTITSNHIHLLVFDQAGKDVIPKSIQLVAGRIGQEYNIRKKRKGAFWEDRYHATAVETGEHLLKCLIYIDLNIVRAGVVKHPSQWYWSGYNEIQTPRRKNILIDYDKLSYLAGYDTFKNFQTAHKKWVENSLATFNDKRESKWSESIAVGSNDFANRILSQLGSRAKGRKVLEDEKSFEVCEKVESYNTLFDVEKCNIGPKNTLAWNEYI